MTKTAGRARGLRKLGRAAAMATAVAGMLLGSAGVSSAAPESSTAQSSSTARDSSTAQEWMTRAKLDQVQFGMTRQQVLDIVGAQTCETGGKLGHNLHCPSQPSGSPYALFEFTGAGLDGLVKTKMQDGLIPPATPTLTLSKYNQTALGMSKAEVLAIVGQGSCVPWSEMYPAYPSTAGGTIALACYEVGGFDPGKLGTGSAYFWFTDDVLEYSREWYLD
ncbi:BLIP family protein [Streptomyces jumonjinensis]|uniref:BLIP family protein n=2 Tax=Streptomyces jumonjinensis TaxID=1945 RepID=UPI0037BBC8FD